MLDEVYNTLLSHPDCGGWAKVLMLFFPKAYIITNVTLVF